VLARNGRERVLEQHCIPTTDAYFARKCAFPPPLSAPKEHNRIQYAAARKNWERYQPAEGAIAEQFIGQHLQELLSESPNRELTYWLREGRSSNAEVDFVMAFEGHIVPIEVKAGWRGSLRSLHQFVGEKHVPLAVRFDSNPPSAGFRLAVGSA
jgi:hypothetical protein